MVPNETGRKHIGAVETSLSIVETLRERDGATVTELSNALDIPKSTVSIHLSTLYDNRYVDKEDGEYVVGLKYLRTGEYAKRHHSLSTVVQPTLDRLAAETGEIVWYMVEEHGKGVYLNKSLGENAVQPVGRVGKRVFLHDIAAGKAILAHLPEDRVRWIVDEHGLTEQTEATISDPDELFDVIERVRERGYALNRDEHFVGFRAAAAPVLIEGDVHGSVVVSGPTSRMSDERLTEDVASLVVDAASELELRWRTRSNA